MGEDDILILKGNEVNALLTGEEIALLRTVELAYEAHAQGCSSLPHSTFLRFPADEKNRIIALPAYLGNEFGVAGMKWIASFPGNFEIGLERASAVVILNSPLTGMARSIMEGSIISAKRTAASAALAARSLQNGRKINNAGILGCGLINFEIVRFLLAVFPEMSALTIYDIDIERANGFRKKCQAEFDGLVVEVVADMQTLFKRASLISIATTASQPHIFDLSNSSRGSTILHVSLRDLAPEIILANNNIVDDIDHVCRAQTSIHLAEQLVGNRDFISGTLADVLRGTVPAGRDTDSITIFSPFGLGILDIAVAKLVYDLSLKQGLGTVVESFLPHLWQKDVAVSLSAG